MECTSGFVECCASELTVDAGIEAIEVPKGSRDGSEELFRCHTPETWSTANSSTFRSGKKEREEKNREKRIGEKRIGTAEAVPTPQIARATTRSLAEVQRTRFGPAGIH